jgi:hypothetical protein
MEVAYGIIFCVMLLGLAILSYYNIRTRVDGERIIVPDG